MASNVCGRCALSGAQDIQKYRTNIFRGVMAATGGLAKLDVGVLNAEQQEKLRQFKIKTRVDNETYLRSHPEVEALMGDFLRDVLLKRPAEICEFAADHFTNPNLHVVIGSKMEGNSDLE